LSDIDKALQTQLKNIQAKTGKTLGELYALIGDSGLEKHGEIRNMLKRDLGLGHGDANTLTHMYSKASEEPTQDVDPLATLYSGSKAHLRPIHETLIAAIGKFGPFEMAPKKTYISLRRKKQFAMIGPATKTRVDVGLNMRGLDATSRLVAEPPGRMCQFKVRLTDTSEVDQELIAWIKNAYDSAG
jgi:hypothetical protein